MHLGDELKQRLNDSAKANCVVELPICLKSPCVIAPLQISKDLDPISAEEQGHFHRRDELIKMMSKPPVDNVLVKDLFIKAKESVEKSASDQHFLNEEAKQAYVSTHSRRIGIIGQAGSGKTTLTKTILNKVVNDGLYSSEFVFYLKLRDVDYNAETNLLSFLSPSLALPWLSDNQRRNAVLDSLAANKNVFIIFDGLDEIENFNDASTNHEINLYKQDKPLVFIKHLLRGKLLPYANVMITSRPKQLLNLPKYLKPRFVVNIVGFDDKAQEIICKSVCEQNSDDIFKSIQSRADISTLCANPLHCLLIMFAMNTARSSQQKFRKSLSAIFAFNLVLFFNSSHIDSSFNLRNVADLAWISFQENKFYLTKRDLRRAGIQVDKRNAFLTSTTSKSGVSLLSGSSNVHYFSHLVLQECLIAIRVIFFTPPSEFKELFIGNVSPQQLTNSQPKYNLADSRFEMITKFMYGFCNEHTRSYLMEEFDLPDFLSEHLEMLQSFAQNRLPSPDSDSYFQDSLSVFTWVSELDNPVFSEQLASHLPSHISIKGRVLPSDVEPVHHILRARRSPVSLSVPYDGVEFVGNSYRVFLRELETTMNNSRYVKVILTFLRF